MWPLFAFVYNEVGTFHRDDSILPSARNSRSLNEKRTKSSDFEPQGGASMLEQSSPARLEVRVGDAVLRCLSGLGIGPTVQQVGERFSSRG